MRFSIARSGIAIVFLASSTVACGSVTIDASGLSALEGEATASEKANPADADRSSDLNPASQSNTTDAIAPGTYCFSTDDSVFQFNVHSDNRVDGVGADAVYIDPNAEHWSHGIYYEFEDATLNGTSLQGNLLQREKGDFTEGSVTWELRASTLVTPLRTYQLADCDVVAYDYPAGWGQGVGRPVSNANSAPAATLAQASTAQTASAPVAPSNVIRFQPADVTSEWAPTASDVLPVLDFTSSETVQFAPGNDYAAIQQRNIRLREGHTYELRAQAGQILNIRFNSYSNASYLYIFAPTGAVMVREANRDIAVELPLNGVYYVTVATWEDSDRYDLTVHIR
jgi:hypothetical protein